MKKFRFALAAIAVAAAASAAVAQPVFLEKRSPYTPAEPTTSKPGETEFKPDPKAGPDPKSLAVPDADFQKTKELAAKLGSTDYAERQQASKELARMGRMALPALQEIVTTSDSAEAVQRAEVLMPKAEAEDMKARVACFLADTKGEYQHTLPGWEKFKAVAGNDKDSRAIFADALKSNVSHQMLLAADKTADEANAVLNTYMTKLQGGNNRGNWDGGSGQPIQIKPADVIMGIFLEGLYTDKEVVIQPNLQWWGGNQFYTVMTNIHNAPEASQAVSGQAVTGKAAVVRKLVIQWMDTRETGQGVQTAYNYAQSMYGNTGKAEDKKKLMKYVAKVFEADNGVNGPWQKINILSQYAQQWGKDGVPVVAKAFEDSTNIWQAQNGNPGYDIQMRDFALACAIQMSDQKVEDYGFSRTAGYSVGKQFNQMAFFFKDDTTKPVGGNPGGGVIVRPRPRVPVPDAPKEEPKKEEPKKEDPKDPKKEEEKLTQDDRRKAAFKKWEEYTKAQAEKKDDKKDPKADPKAEPKKDAPKDTVPPPPDPRPEGPGDLPLPKK